jgi:hypothetical protein
MAEVLGIISAAGGILTSLAKVISRINSLHNAPRDARELSREVESLRAVIENLKVTMEVSGATPSQHWLETTATVFRNAEETSKRLERSVDSSTASRNLIGRIKWTLNAAETQRYCTRLGSYTRMLNILQGSVHWYVFPCGWAVSMLIRIGRVPSELRECWKSSANPE